ncbi:MAG: putative sulfate exporter family transporter [Pseudomonadota bacterium]
MNKATFIICALACLLPFVSGAIALTAGILFVLLFGNPFSDITPKITPQLLAVCIVGLGAGMNLSVILDSGISGIVYTVTSIGFAMGLGLALGRLFQVGRNITTLISFGSAICGGSAIAAAAPVLKAKDHEISIALGVVFILNALALFIFPVIGNWLGLSQNQFGLWAAIAIHDTSSVVGASMAYGHEAMEVAVTVKMVRALWILPLVLALAFIISYQNVEKDADGEKAKMKVPWFIPGFVIAACLVTFFPALESTGYAIAALAEQLMVLTLFLIGTALSRQSLQEMGMMPFLYGAVLWVIISITVLVAVMILV